MTEHSLILTKKLWECNVSNCGADNGGSDLRCCSCGSRNSSNHRRNQTEIYLVKLEIVLRAEKQVARPYIFHAFLSPPWESLRHCLAQSTAVNTSSIGWLSLETHWSLVLFPSTHLYQGRIYSVRFFLHALRQAIQLDHWKSSPRKPFSQVSRMKRCSLPSLLQQGMGPFWGKLRMPTTEKMF